MSNKKNGENENDCDTGLFLRTPNDKGRQNLYFADSETKINVSPFFNKKWMLNFQIWDYTS